MSLSNFLTAAQIGLIPEYQEKWRRVLLNTQPIDRTKAAASVHQAYRIMGRPLPEVIFCPTPRAALDRLQIYISQVDPPRFIPILGEWTRDCPMSFQFIIGASYGIFILPEIKQRENSNTVLKLKKDLENLHFTSLEKYIESKNLSLQEIIDYLQSTWIFSRNRENEANRINSSEQERENIYSESERQAFLEFMDNKLLPVLKLFSILSWKRESAHSIIRNVKIALPLEPDGTINFTISRTVAETAFLAKNPYFSTRDLIQSCTWIDFAISVLNFPFDREKWYALKELTEQCGWIFPMGKFCIVCDRPANN